MTAKGKTVWLVGSGFSKSLGGPLLTDLFKQDRAEDLESVFSKEEFGDLASVVFCVQGYFNQGMKDGLWTNAESFLAYVDEAYRARGKSKKSRIRSLLYRTSYIKIGDSELKTPPLPVEQLLPDFDRIVRRALGAECFEFIMDHETRTERWKPYREWVKSLEPERDTVVCFNYDIVIETVLKRLVDDHEKCPVSVRLPGTQDQASAVPVLKLHGSVDWVLSDGGTVERKSVADILRSDKESIAIASPGASKEEFVTKHLESLWSQAEDALAEALTVVFVGYSFPQTDPAAQLRLLRAFSEDRPLAKLAGAHPANSIAIPARKAHIVLGCRDEPAISRLAAMIESGRGERRLMNETSGPFDPLLAVKRQPLYAEDFIGRSAAYLR